jgi:hypothetical protein
MATHQLGVAWARHRRRDVPDEPRSVGCQNCAQLCSVREEIGEATRPGPAGFNGLAEPHRLSSADGPSEPITQQSGPEEPEPPLDSCTTQQTREQPRIVTAGRGQHLADGQAFPRLKHESGTGSGHCPTL